MATSLTGAQVDGDVLMDSVDKRALDKAKTIDANPLFEIPRGMQEMQRLEKDMENLADTIVHQREPSTFNVVSLNDVDHLNQE